MQASRWQEVQDIFDKALEMPPAKRDAYLKDACGDDENLLGDVTTMLRIHHRSHGDNEKSMPKVPPEDSDTTSLIGESVGHYKVESRIGVGGMGVVYKAHDGRLDRHTALKCLPLNMAGDKLARERFINEAKAASRLDHPNICAIFDIGELPDGQLYIAMPYYQGSTLAKVIKKGKMDHTEVVNVIHNIAQGLKAAHSNDIVHRDVKPANIMLTEDGGVKILDFGVAKMAGVEMTGTGNSVGTAAYMAPEQLTGSKIDHRADIWSLGVVLYEMLTGKRAFAGDNVYALIYSIINTEPDFPKDIPDFLLNLLQKCMARDVNDRIQSIDDFLECLVGDETAATRVDQATHNIDVPKADHAGWDDELLEIISRAFTRYIGPIAPVMVKREASNVEEVESLLQALALKLSDDQPEKFINSVKKKLNDPDSYSSSGVDTIVNAITPDQITTAEEALRYYVGPVASAMVKRAMQQSATFEALAIALSESLETEQEKNTFLATLGFK